MIQYIKVTDDRKFCSKCRRGLERGTLYKQETISSPRYWLEFTGQCCMSEEDLIEAKKVKVSDPKTNDKKVSTNEEQIEWEY